MLQRGISACRICLFRADLLPLKMCQLCLLLFLPARFLLDFCSISALLRGFCSLYAPLVLYSARGRGVWFGIDLEKVAQHPVLNEEGKVVSDHNVGIVEALKLMQLIPITLFIARRLEEATASEKAGTIRTAHAQLKELKARRGKGGFAELANWIILPPGHGSVWGVPSGQAHPPYHASGGFGGDVFSSSADDFGSICIGGACGGGGGHTSGGSGHYGPTNGRSHQRRGGRGGRGRGPAVCRKCTLPGSTSTNHPHTV